ncbi:hypothetical protein L7F22_060629 [Adiantum nelumboides]|nr:hypothetical protein [Adiantum nelumboides]
MQEDSLEDKAGIHLSLQGEAPGDGVISESVTLEITEIKDDKERVTLSMKCSMPSTCAGKSVQSGESARVEETYQEEGNHSNGKSNQKLELEIMKDNDCELFNVLSGECVCGEETYQEEGNPSNGKSNQEFESEITRDNDCELSFKYIAASSLKSNVHLGEKKRTHRLAKLSPEASGEGDEVTATPGLSLELPPTNQESSDDYESDSSLSESPSHIGSDAEFDFPTPSAESMHSAKLSEMLIKPRTPEGPHQLEWQDADYNFALSTFQKSKGSAVSSTGFVGGIASNVAMAQMKFGAKGETDDGELHIKNDLSKITVSRRLDITVATGSISLHGQRGTAVGKIEGLAKLKENIASESYNKVPVSGAISGECVDKDSLVGLLNEQKLNLYGEPKDKPLGSSRTVAEQSLQQKPLGIVRAHMQSSGTDASSSTFLGDRERKPCLTVKEDELIESVANVVLKESTSSLQDNVLGTLHSIEKRERQAPGYIVITGEDAEYARYDLRKVSDSGVVGLPNGFRQTNNSQSGLKSEGHYHQDYFGKEVQFQKRVEAVKVSDPNSKEQHKSYSSNAAQLLNGKDVASI